MTIVAIAKPHQAPYGSRFAQRPLVAPFQRPRRMHQEAGNAHGSGSKTEPFGELTYGRSGDEHHPTVASRSAPVVR